MLCNSGIESYLNVIKKYVNYWISHNKIYLYTRYIFIFLSVPPLEVHIEEKKRALSAQKPVELVCRAAGSRPPANITWTIGHLPLKGTKEKISSEGNITTGRLTFVPTIEDRGKNITCRAENMLIPGSAIYDMWQVDVHCKYFLSGKCYMPYL